MDDIENALKNIFSSPESIEKIKNLAQTLTLGESASEKTQNEPPELPINPAAFGLFSKAMREYSKSTETAELIRAITPYLSRGRSEKVDKAFKVAKMIKAAKLIMPEIGGAGNDEPI